MGKRKVTGQDLQPTAFILLTFLFLGTGCATAAPPRPEDLSLGDFSKVTDYLRAAIPERMKKANVPGLSVAIVDEGSVLWQEGFGYADKRKGLPATTETIYRVGSISKLLVTTAAMRLVEDGKLGLDRPLSDYLPELFATPRVNRGSLPTVRSLMTHHSGLPHDLMKGMWTEHPEPYCNIVSRLGGREPSYPPNLVYSYSDVGMTLLGCVVERVSGETFPNYVARTVIRPLGMSHSYFSTHSDNSALGSKGYRKGNETPEPQLRDVPAAGLNSSASDLGKFLRMFLALGRAENGEQVLRPETVREMLRPQNQSIPLDLNFRVGLGWALSGLGNIGIQNAGLVAHHAGSTFLFNGQVVIMPEHKLGVVVLANSDSAKAVVDETATEAAVLALEARAGIRQPLRLNVPDRTDGPSVDEIRRYEGYYATIAGLTKVENTRGLTVAALGTHFNLVPREDGLCRLQYKVLGLFPVSLGDFLDHVGISRQDIASHEVIKATWNRQDLLLGERIQPSPIPQSWRQRIGEYDVVNPGEDAFLPKGVALVERDGFVVLRFYRDELMDKPGEFPLTLLSDSRARLAGIGTQLGEVITVVDHQGAEQFDYGGFLFQKRR